jgi:hypothetical protein
MSNKTLCLFNENNSKVFVLVNFPEIFTYTDWLIGWSRAQPFTQMHSHLSFVIRSHSDVMT